MRDRIADRVDSPSGRPVIFLGLPTAPGSRFAVSGSGEPLLFKAFEGVDESRHRALAVDPAVDFGLQFQATVADMAPAEPEHPENDGMELADGEPVDATEDGSNVVTVDFGRKK